MLPLPLPDGVIHLRGFLSLDEQQQLVERCRALGATGGFYTPVVRGGGKMHLQMLCLGMHWNPATYTYEPTRADHDGRRVPSLPPDLAALARRAAQAAEMTIEPQVCLVNYYTPGGRLGLHQDKDERGETLAAGIPIVSISLGDTAKFMLGGLRRRDSIMRLLVESGDALVMGGPARLRYHGVSAILPGTAPAALQLDGRFNLTFRQYALEGLRSEERGLEPQV